MMRSLLSAVAVALVILSAGPSWPQSGTFDTRASADAWPPDVRTPTAAEAARFAELDAEWQRLNNIDPGIDEVYRELLARAEVTYGPNHPLTAHYGLMYAYSLSRRGLEMQAEARFRRAHAINTARFGAQDERTVDSGLALAANLYAQNRHADAVAAFAEVWPNMTEVTGVRRGYLTNYAMSLLALGMSEDAVRIMRQRIAVVERDAPQTSEHADALRDLAWQMAFSLNQSLESFPYFQRALSIRDTLSGEQDAHARLIGEYVDAMTGVNRYAQALPLARRLVELRSGRGENSREYADALQRLARCLDLNADAREVTEIAQRILANTGADPYARGRAYAMLAAIAASETRLVDAERDYLRALAIADTPGEAGSNAMRMEVLGLLANFYAGQNRVEEQAALLQRLLELREAAGFDLRIADVLAELGVAQVTLGRRDEALGSLRRAAELYERALGPSAPETVAATAQLGMYEAQLSAGAQSHVQSATLEQTRRAADTMFGLYGENDLRTAMARFSLAVLLSNQGQSAEADRVLRQVLPAFETQIPESTETNLIRGVLASVEVRAGRPLVGLALARRALASQASAAMRTGAATPDVALLAGVNLGRRQAGAVLAETAWAAVEQDHALIATLGNEAFEAAQIAGISGADDALALGGARIAAEQAGLRDVVTAWRNAQNRIAVIDDELVASARRGAGGDAERPGLLAERERLDRERAARENEVRARFPRYFNLLESSTVSIDNVARLLRSDEALFLISRASNDSSQPFLFVLTSAGARWTRIALTQGELRTEIDALHAMLEAGGATRSPGGALGPRQVRGFDRARAHRLYEAIFGGAEIAAVLDGKTSWVIAPHGAAMSLPFAALVTQAPQGDDSDPDALRATHWLGLERALSITPSISALRAQRGTTPQAIGSRLPFFGIGDPLFQGAETQTAALESSRFYSRNAVNIDEVRGLPRLSRTAVEIRALARSLGAGPDSFVLGSRATEAELLIRDNDGRLGRTDVIAFATHGLVAGDLANSLAEPALALTPPSGRVAIDPRNDGLLTASEAARLRLSARWVILSACNTAAGGRANAEGLSGLARAFFYAGARTLLVSHWPVGDVAAERLTTRAVALSRSEGVTTAEALRRSMRDLMADTSGDTAGRSFAHPSAWAPFALVSAE